MLFAHSLPGRPEVEWEPLQRHLREVGELAASFAEAFDGREWGRLAGWWHDAGKSQPQFQARLRGARVQVEHSGVGAALAASKSGAMWQALAFAIAGHHGGLPNEQTSSRLGQAPLGRRLSSSAPLLNTLERLPEPMGSAAIPPAPPWAARLASLPISREDRQRRLRLAVDMFTRFLFSALVDADRLATERFLAPNPLREPSWPSLAAINLRLDAFIDALRDKVDPMSRVNTWRDEVLRACRARACEPAGIFSLTVPTGGGKTLAAMSFALRHAVANHQRRVIVVIPYTSIIEQNAAVYRQALGSDVVIEHHTNFDEESAREDSEEREARRRCAVENWDAAIIVTTSVQFLETLFTNRPSKVRKLHNVARSVLLMDEVQTLPPGLLAPILDGLQELTERYGCTVVLSTATPPSLARTPTRDFGLEGVREIIPDPAALSTALRRVSVRWPNGSDDVTSWDALSREVMTRRQALVVVHRREDARSFASMLPAEGRFHLSASMCPAHRTAVLARVKACLENGEACRLVSTQLVEAGVDIDFPVVYRAMAGLDSLAQSAGRCNREGRLRGANGLPALGEFIVFRAESDPPRGVLRQARDVMNVLVAAHAGSVDIHEPATCTAFFDQLYFVSDLDRAGIQENRRQWNFADVGADFSLIDDYSQPLVVPWGDARVRVEAFRRWADRSTRRALQPFVLMVRPRELGALKDDGKVEQLDEGIWVLGDPFAEAYSEEFGLHVQEVKSNPERFVF